MIENLASWVLTSLNIVILSILGYLLLLVLVRRDNYYLLALYTAIFFLRPGETLDLFQAMRLELIIAIITLASIGLSSRAMNNLRTVFTLDRIPKAFLMFVIVICLGVPFAYWPGQAFRSLVDFLKLCLFCLMIIALVDTEKKLHNFAWLFVLFSAWVGFLPSLYLLEGQTQFAQGIDRVRGAARYFDNPNVLACTLTQAVPFLIYLFVFEVALLRRIILALLFCLLTTVIVFTGSRGAFLSYVAVFVIIFVWQSKRKGLGIIALCLVGISLYWFMPDQYVERQKTMLDLEHVDRSTSRRFEAWKDGVELFVDSPVLGVGIGNFGPARGAAFEDWLWPHNLVIQLISETGMLGAISWAYLMALVLNRSKETSRVLRTTTGNGSVLLSVNNALFASILVQLVAGISQHNLYLFGFYFMISLLLVVGRLVNRNTSPTAIPS
jgi:O-antigen ligase